MEHDKNRIGGHVKYSSAKSAKEYGMDRVGANANEEFRSLMSALVRAVARSRKLFTSDHVFDLFFSIPGRPETHDYRAFGPVMKRAVRDGVCEKHNSAPINSNRRKLHGSPRQVWKSMIYKKNDAVGT